MENTKNVTQFSSDNKSDSIVLTINRLKRELKILSIAYIEVSNKLCTIHLKDGSELSFFSSLSAFGDKLNSSQFLKISRSSIVSMDFIESINGTCVALQNGKEITFSQRSRYKIMQQYQTFLDEKQFHNQQDHTLNISNGYKSLSIFDNCPYAVVLIEMISNNGTVDDFTFRYGNRAFSILEHKPLSELLNNNFSKIFPGHEEKWMKAYGDVAFNGDFQVIETFSPEVNRVLSILTYQFAYGYCLCIMRDSSNEYKEKTAGRLLKQINTLYKLETSRIDDILKLNDAVEIKKELRSFQRATQLINSIQENWRKNILLFIPEKLSLLESLLSAYEQNYVNAKNAKDRELLLQQFENIVQFLL